MNTRKTLMALTVVAIMCALVSAQSRRGWGNKTVAGAAPNTVASSQESDDSPNRLDGTWRAIETFPDNSAFKVLFTFSAGRDDKSGTTIHSDELFLTGGPSCLPTQGVWKRTGDRTFIVTDEGFCFDPFANPIFAPVGKLTFKSTLTLNARGTAFDGPMHVEAFDQMVFRFLRTMVSCTESVCRRKRHNWSSGFNIPIARAAVSFARDFFLERYTITNPFWPADLLTKLNLGDERIYHKGTKII